MVQRDAITANSSKCDHDEFLSLAQFPQDIISQKSNKKHENASRYRPKISQFKTQNVKKSHENVDKPERDDITSANRNTETPLGDNSSVENSHADTSRRRAKY